MIEFKLLKIQSFKSIFKADLNFEQMKGNFYSLEGINKTVEFASSNGSGKTTCLSALAFVLYGTTLDIYMKAEEYQNKNTNLPLTLELVFNITHGNDRGNYVVIRTLKTVKLYKNEDDITELTKTATEKKLQDILGITKDEFFSFTYLTQYAGGNFLNKTASEKLSVIKDFVFGDELLAIKSKLESLIKEMSNKYNSLTSDINRLEGNIESLNSVLLQDRISCDINDRDYENNLKLVDKLKQQILEVTKHQQEKIRLETEISNLKKQMQKLKNELDIVNSHICPTCGQQLHDDNVEQKIRNKAKEIKQNAIQIKQQMQNINKTEQNLDIESIQQNIDELIEQNNAYKINRQLEQKQQYARDNIEQFKQKQKSLEKDCDKLVSDLKQVKDLQKYFTTIFIQHVQQSFLSEIENYLNLYCYDVFNAEFKLQFTGNSLELLVGGKPYSYFSGGERQRIDFLFVFAIKVALSSFTDKCTNLLLCDESLSAQDNCSYENCIELIKQLSEASGLTTILVSHRNTGSTQQNKIVLTRYNDKTKLEIFSM